MPDGTTSREQDVRSALYVARNLASQGNNPLLIYLIEAALAELDEQGLRQEEIAG